MPDEIMQCIRCGKRNSRRWWQRIGEPDVVLCAECRWHIDRVRVSKAKREMGKHCTPQRYEPCDMSRQPRKQRRMTAVLNPNIADRWILYASMRELSWGRAMDELIAEWLDEDGMPVQK